jgi:hypothetical protein
MVLLWFLVSTATSAEALISATSSEQVACHRFFILKKVVVLLLFDRFEPIFIGRATV